MSTLTTTHDPIDAVRALAPELRDRALEGERLGTLPADLVTRVQQARLFELALPRTLGGLELDPHTIVEVIEQCAYADGSAAWTIMIGNSTSFLAWLDPSVAAKVVAGGAPRMASVFGPLGRAVPTGDGVYSVDGRWPFNSGAPHAEAVMNGVFVMDGDRPRMLPEGRPDWRFALMPRCDLEIITTWDAMGLRGTGSHDVAVSGALVADELTIMPFDASARHDGPLWRLPFWGLLNILMVGIPLGIAQRALDECAGSVGSKHRPDSPCSVGEDAHLQAEFARAETHLHAARAMVVDTLGVVWDLACNGDIPTGHQVARCQVAGMEAIRAGVEAVTVALRAGGASAVYSTSPIQRCFRDLHTLAQHIAFSDERWKSYARTRFGLGVA